MINICAQTFPFAAKIREVTPINAAIRVNKLKSPDTIFETVTTIKETIQIAHSFFVKSINGLFMCNLRIS